MTSESTVNQKWREALSRPAFMALFVEGWIVWWVILRHSRGLSHTPITHLAGVVVLIAAMLYLPLPIFWSYRSLREVQIRLSAHGAQEQDIALLTKAAGTILTLSYVAIYFCLFAVVGFL